MKNLNYYPQNSVKKKCTLQIVVFICALIFCTSGPVYAQYPLMSTEADKLIREGANCIYNLQFDKAEKYFKEVQRKYPGHPAGYFLDAMVDWWKITIYPDSRQYDRQFVQKIDKVVQISQSILDTLPMDVKALFFKGGAIGYRGRFYANRESWFRAATDGKNAFDILVQIQMTQIINCDIMLGLGIYNYFAAVFPDKYPALKALMIFLPKGDKQIGLLQLKGAAANAKYADIEAKVVLMQIYYQFEHDYWNALNMSQELYTRYPNNPFFERYYGRSLVATGQFERQEAIWRDALNKYINHRIGYDKRTAREALYYVAAASMTKGELNKAAAYFSKCDEACRAVDGKVPSGFRVQANLRLGKIYDLQKKRALAITYYHKVLGWQDYNGSKNEAKNLIKYGFR